MGTTLEMVNSRQQLEKRIFPDSPVPPDQLPDDEDREAYRKAKVVVQVWGETNAAKTVYLHLFDPDDLSALLFENGRNEVTFTFV